jgi:hypothetical protein
MHFQRAIQHMNADVEALLDGVRVPSHLLLLHHSFSHNLVDGCPAKPVEIRWPARYRFP